MGKFLCLATTLWTLCLGVALADGCEYFKTKDYSQVSSMQRAALSERAMSGDMESEMRLAVFELCGLGVKQDAQNGLSRLRKAADKGSATAQIWMFRVYESGTGVDRDEAQALMWLRRAAQQGSAEGQALLGYVHFEGHGVPKDYVEASRWLLKAAAQGSAPAQTQLSQMYFSGTGVTQSHVEALNWLNLAASQNFASAQNLLGEVYLDDVGVEADDAAALKWFEKAASRGDSVAQFNMGRLSLDGRGVAKDDAQARKWFLLAAVKRLVSAQFALGTLNYEGLGGAKDFAEALKWYRLAAEQRFTPAHIRIGWMYFNGQGVATDVKAALEWWRQAKAIRREDVLAASSAREFTHQYIDALAEKQFDAVAGESQEAARVQTQLAAMYLKSGEVELADKWYRRAAVQGDTDAQLGLARALRQGSLKNVSEAVEMIRWNEVAAALGDSHATSALSRVYQYGPIELRDFNKHLAWTRLASERSEVGALLRLGEMYATGDGVPLNRVVSYALVFMLVERTMGVEAALAAFHPLVEANMTTKEIENAKALVFQMLKPGNFLVALDRAVEN